MSRPVIDLEPVTSGLAFETRSGGHPRAAVSWLRCGLVFYVSAASSFTFAFLVFQLLN